MNYSIFPRYKIKFMNKVVNGSTPKSSVEEYWDGDILWVTPEDLSKSNNPSINETKRKITKRGYESCGTTLCPDNSIVLSTRAPIGSIGIASKPLCTNQGCKTLVPYRNILFRYEFYQLSVCSDILNSLGKGTTFRELSAEEFKNFKLFLPPLETQKQIADYLDKETTRIDNLISKKQKQIELLQEKRQALITQAVTRGLNPDVKMKDSGVEWIGEIPEHWEIVRLKYLVKLQGGFAFSSDDFVDDGVQLIKIASLYNNELHLERQPTFVPESFLEQYSDWIVKKDYILMSMTGTLGKRDYGFAVKIEDEAGVYLLNQRVSKIHSVKRVDINLLIHILRSDYFLDNLFLLPSGTKQGNLSNEQVLGLPIIIPPNSEEQLEIVDYISREYSRVQDVAHQINHSIDLLKEYRSSLITHAVSGQIDLTEFTKVTEGEEDIQ